MIDKPFDTLDEYRRELTQFLQNDDRVAPFRSYRPPDFEAGAETLREVQVLLFDEGWSRIGWPTQCGGLGGDPRCRGVLFEAMWDADIQIPESYTTLEILVPVMLVFAPHLAEALLPGLLRGDDAWAQAFSEPEAGSDLASLRTRMEPDGDGWRVTGQKVWSTYAHLSQRSVLLARSGEPGHRGLTMILIDLDQPGIDVRPIRAQDGGNHFSEIFLDNAYVPSDRIIGELGQGWKIAMYMLQWERGAWGWLQQGRFHNRLRHLLSRTEIPRTAGVGTAELGRGYAATSALRLQTRETVNRLADEEELGPEVSIDKLLLIEAELAVWNAMRHLAGTNFDMDPDLKWLREEFMFSRAAPIYGGSLEIQRTLVAQRVLGMPRA
jgi:alkylation response protein AidB-like acyl-CoA dehydrogenase